MHLTLKTYQTVQNREQTQSESTEYQSNVSFLASQLFLLFFRFLIVILQQKFLIGVSAAFFFHRVCGQSKTEHGSGREMKYALLYHRVSARRHFNTAIKRYEKGIKPQHQGWLKKE